jgi:hypothetical protein
LFLQAVGLAEKLLTNNNGAIMEAMFKAGSEFAMKNPGVISNDEVAWFKAAITKPGAATATLNYYRAFLDFNVNSKGDEPVWK